MTEKPQKMNLSAVIIAKDEQENIGRCILSVKFCDEIVVIDDHSTDKTAQIAKKLGAQVITRDLMASFSDQRNFGLIKARGKWVIFVDADEVISDALRKEILTATNKKINYVSGYLFKRIDHVWNQKIKHGEVGDARFLRLAQRRAGKWHRRVHEHWHVIGQVREFKNPILHYPHQTLREFLTEVNDRSTLHALANKDEGKYANLAIIVFAPFFKFMYGYILRFGFLDGKAGFVIAMVMSLHSFLSWSKLWFIQQGTK